MRINLNLPLWMLCFIGCWPAIAQESVDEPQEKKQPPTIQEMTEGMTVGKGFFTFYWDEKQGRMLLEIDNLDSEFLMIQGLGTGLGSNPVGLDRGKLGQERVVKFKRVGPRVFLEQRNLRYRAQSDSATERRAVAESFATSVLWGGKIEAESDGKVLVDFTPMLTTDVQQIARTLKRANQGDFSLDRDRSHVHLERCKAFPDNTELEASLTFQSKNPGPYVRETAPTPEAMTIRQHVSLIRLPDDGYQPRRFDPRVASYAMGFADYAKPIDQPLETRLITRHRLKKQDPSAAMSEPVEPIVYYVDPGAPQPIRDALIEGASWWNQAFEAAGFKNAFQVKLLPADADPLDVRYNVIMWVHRSTRGWSYGNSITDPRTGEIMKGHVTLGSLRVRQDILLMDGLMPSVAAGPQACGCCRSTGSIADVLSADDQTRREVALARIRQLSAHEVGHTLGFAHNFAASTYGRASVMDYPAPLVKISDDQQFDFSEAYDVGIGDWDKFSVKYAYSEFNGDEQRHLQKMIQQSLDRKMLFLSDEVARPIGGTEPLASLWDNGSDSIVELRHMMRVRRLGLDRFASTKLPPDAPEALMQYRFVPLYLHHRYQVAATVKEIGGVQYRYAVSGDGQVAVRPIPVERQKAALDELIRCLSPEELVISKPVLRRLPPLPFGYGDRRELFPQRTAPLFDPLAAAEVASDMVIAALLHPQRASRLVAYDSESLDLNTMIRTLFQHTWGAERQDDPEHRAVQRVVETVLLRRLMALSVDGQASTMARAITEEKLRELVAVLERVDVDSDRDRAHRRTAAAEIRRHLNRPAAPITPSDRLQSPPGSPIGSRD